jgi:transposase-like protein
MTVPLTRDDLQACARDGMGVTDVARDLGLTRSKVYWWSRKHGVALPKKPCHRNHLAPVEQVRAQVQDMTPLDAVEYLLALMESHLGHSEIVCHWPDVPLQPMQRALVQYLYLREGRICTKAAIMDALYAHSQTPPDEGILPVMVSHLRRKLAGTGYQIETIWGVGYRMTRAAGAVFPWEVQT